MADIFADDFKLENEENKSPELNPFSFSNFVRGKASTSNDREGESASTSKSKKDTTPVVGEDGKIIKCSCYFVVQFHF